MQKITNNYAITCLCFIWILLFVCLGFSAKGVYGQVTALFFDDAKEGTIVLHYIVPVLLSGTLAALLTTKTSVDDASSLSSYFPSFVHRLNRRWNAGETDFKSFSILFVVVPLSLLVLTTIHRHLYRHQLSLDDEIMEISNAFAIMALCAMGLFLIPVAKQGPILKLIQWTPAAAIRLHINAGRLLILGSILHGGGHIYRWIGLAAEEFWNMILPPTPCWSLDSGDYTPECNDSDTDCTCYDLFRNLTGVLAAMCMIVIVVTSTNYVRRHHYRIFYLTHILAAPSYLLLVIVHWNKSVLYMAPSLLYYAASSAPVIVEQATSSRIKVHSITRIQSTSTARACIALTIDATERAVHKYAPGQYVKLSVPEISRIGHPFTINKVPGQPTQLRIICRVTGDFTRALANHRQPQPIIDGYHGTQLRMLQVLQHDVVVMVAAGIGITPYLSILGDLRHDLVTKEVVLHWICRETELVEYIRREYFDPLLASQQENGIKLRLIVHKTGTTSAPSTTATSTWSDYELRTPQDLEEGFADEGMDEVIGATTAGVAFEPSKFSTGQYSSFLVNLPIFFTFGSISWVGLYGIMVLYDTNNAEEVILYRGWAAVFTVSLSMVAAVLGNCLVRSINLDVLDSARVHLGTVWSRVNGNEAALHSLELSEPHRHESSSSAGANDSTSLATYEERDGRPTMHELLRAFDEARCPGLFSCGPSGFMTDLRDAAEEKCMMRIRQCLGGPEIAMYGEKFEL